MKRLRKYVRKRIRDTFQEETSSSEKKNDVETQGSLWGAAFAGSGQREKGRDPMKVQGSMWDVKFGAPEATGKPETAPAPKKAEAPKPKPKAEPRQEAKPEK